MFELNAEDKQMRLKKDLTLLASLKSKTASLPKASISLFSDPVETLNLFNTNLSYHSIDKNISKYGFYDSMGANVQNDNINTNKTNLSFSLFPYHFQHDTILSFNLEAPKDMDQYYPIHKTNESFVFNLNPHQHNSLLKIEKKPPKEESVMSTQKQTQADFEMTINQDYENEAVVFKSINNTSNSKSNNNNNNNNNNKSLFEGIEKSINGPKCLHKNCDFIFRTLKQKLAHHHKMSSECKTDTILLLTSIKNLKHLLKVLKKKKKVQMNDIAYKYLLTKYEKIMRNLSLSEHVEMLTGYSISNQ